MLRITIGEITLEDFLKVCRISVPQKSRVTNTSHQELDFEPTADDPGPPDPNQIDSVRFLLFMVSLIADHCIWINRFPLWQKQPRH